MYENADDITGVYENADDITWVYESENEYDNPDLAHKVKYNETKKKETIIVSYKKSHVVNNVSEDIIINNPHKQEH